MAKEKTLREDSTQPVTKGLLDEAVDTLLKGMDNLFLRFKGELDEFKKETVKRFDGIDYRLDKVETDISFLKRDVRDIKADVSDTPTREELNKLKARVDRIHPTS